MSTIADCLLLVLLPGAFAQVELSERIQKITVPVRDAGVLGFPSGKLSAPDQVSTTRDVIYDNTCDSGGYYISAVPEEVIVDEGLLPAPGSPTNRNCLTGCATSYKVNAFQFAYCTYNTAPQVVIGFDGEYQTCNPSSMADPLAASFMLALPGSPAQGELSCWTVTIELGNQAFVLPANGGHAPIGVPRFFGWSVEFLSSQGSIGNEGPIFAGDIYDRDSCPPCAGTIWSPLSDAPGTGRGTQDALMLILPQLPFPYCTQSTHPPILHSLWLKLYSDDACPPEPGTSTCFGSNALCPCGNGGYVDTGCDNPQETGGVRLRTFDFVPDGLGGGAALLEGSGYPYATSPSAIVIRSVFLEPQAVVFGDGLRCIGLNGLVRMAATPAANGISSHPINHGAGPGTFHYQIWYRSQPASFCNASAAFNLSSAYSLTW